MSAITFDENFENLHDKVCSPRNSREIECLVIPSVVAFVISGGEREGKVPFYYYMRDFRVFRNFSRVFSLFLDSTFEEEGRRFLFFYTTRFTPSLSSRRCILLKFISNSASFPLRRFIPSCFASLLITIARTDRIRFMYTSKHFDRS